MQQKMLKMTPAAVQDETDAVMIDVPLLEYVAASLKTDTDGIFSSQKRIADRILDRLFIVTGTAAPYAAADQSELRY